VRTLSATRDTTETLDVQKQITHDGRRLSSGPLPRSEPFEAYLEVPVAGGVLNVGRAGPAPEPGATVVLGLHGMSGSHMVFRTLARELGGLQRPMTLLAPDLRGRGRSAQLREPFGMAAHLADLMAVLDHAGVDRAILVGHSMGCNIAARFAAEHPDRTAAVLLLDSGLPLISEKSVNDGTPGLFDRFEATYASSEDYMAYWRKHPALRNTWDEDMEAFARCDFVEEEGRVRCAVNVNVVLADVADLTFDGVTWRAVTRVRAPVRLMRAERGMYDDEPLIPLPELHEFLQSHPSVTAELIPGVNHFTLLIGDGHGPHRVAGTVAELAAG
jgi:lipase